MGFTIVILLISLIIFLLFYKVKTENFESSIGKSSKKQLELKINSVKYNPEHRYHFVHIGKCGGTFFYKTFNFYRFNGDRTHINRPIFNPVKKYIIWIRNPINRFVSAFNYGRQVENFDVAKIDRLIKNKTPLTVENCLSPNDVIKLYNNNVIGDREYRHLFKYFDTPNKLAEGLTSQDSKIRNQALKIMKTKRFDFTNSHISKGIGYYLYNGDFVERYHDNIVFVGRKEYMKQDIDKLSSIMGWSKYKTYRNQRVVPKNSKTTYLSPLAIKNIKNFYRDTDYKALDKLLRYNFIDELTRDQYEKYKPDI